MKEWVFIIFCVSLAGGMINLIAAGNASEKHIRFICGICCVLAAASPIKTLIVNVNDQNDKDIHAQVSLPDGNEYLKTKTEKQVKEYIKEHLYGKTGILPTDISIEITVTDTETVIGDITVAVPEKDLKAAKEALDGMAEVICDG